MGDLLSELPGFQQPAKAAHGARGIRTAFVSDTMLHEVQKAGQCR